MHFKNAAHAYNFVISSICAILKEKYSQFHLTVKMKD